MQTIIILIDITITINTFLAIAQIVKIQNLVNFIKIKKVITYKRNDFHN